MDNQVDLTRTFPGDSEMARRMREFDWSSTTFGPPQTWPENLRLAVSLCLPSRFPILLWWGPEFKVLYNDAYIPWLLAKHPRVLARPGRECWSELWDTIGPMLEGVRTSGTATWSEEMQMYFVRKLPCEEVYMTFTYAPILAADAKTVEGIFCPVFEATERVVGARRLEMLRKLGIRSVEARTPGTICQQAAVVLRENPRDVPFAAIYVLEDTGTTARRMGAVFPNGDHFLPTSISIRDGLSSWPLASVDALRAQDVEIGTCQAIQGAAWPDPVTKAVVLPIPGSTPDRVAGILVAGVGPRCVLDAAYRSFFDLAARHIGTALAAARASEVAEINRAKTAFFSNVSHEFRTPLTLILGPTEAALQTPERALRGSELELVHRNELRVLKLVNTLLDFSHIEAGQIQAVYEPTDIAEFTADLASTFRSAMEKAGLEFDVRADVVPEPVYVDRDMWEKIVLNLISNAFKFTFQGTVSVFIGPGKAGVKLQVRDTGSGIPESELPHVFERFHRVAGVKGRSFEGTGIGLALVQELSKVHGGSVRVESTEGTGSCFTVEIPTRKDHLPQDRIGAARSTISSEVRAESYVEEALRWLPADSPTSHEPPILMQPDPTAFTISAVADGRTSATPELIVLAEDNADMRTYLRRLLGRQYRVHAVANGAEALKAVRELGADLVLADIMMPVLDGFGLLKALRADDANKLKPIILLSARAGEESRIEGLEGGADDYLVKPFTTRELFARVGAHLKMARVRVQAAETERRLRAEVEVARDQLEAKVNERTAELKKAQESLRTLNHDLLLAQEDERRRLALELHDGAGQWLVALKWKLGSLPQPAGEDGARFVAGLRDSLKMLDSLSRELRTVSHLLHPALLEDAGLLVALQHYVGGLFDRSGLAVDLQIDPALQRLPRDVEATVFRIVQEGLTNVHRHAGTMRSAVQITATADGVGVQIKDNGQGIPGFVSLDHPNVKLGVGIQGMRERVRHVGGSFDLRSDENGTTINAILPLKRVAA